MASSAIKTEDEKKEFFDSDEVVDRKVHKLVKMILKSKHFIAFTGAGISTSCGIPDFRSGYNTVLPTGPGAWEELAQKKPPKRSKVVHITEAIPSKTHMALVSLLQNGHLKHIVSQNVDGLHRKSGIPKNALSELHGNIYLEKCKVCNKEYIRDVDVVTSNDARVHLTGNKCDNIDCQGDLVDNIINFGENLDSNVINRAFREAELSDLCLAMGSSLRVNPAARIPKEVAKKGGKVVIVNLQKTPLDSCAKMVIHAFCDVVIEKVMRELRLQIPIFSIQRFIRINKNERSLEIKPIDEDGEPFSFLKSVRVKDGEKSLRICKGQYFFEALTCKEDIRVKLRFQGHYGEPSLKVLIPSDCVEEKLSLKYSPMTGIWEVNRVY
ncbi:hypothetical protein SteCoe_25187 [Stentor coeruleus]|uniref:Regulatory protein SIR2 homolog 7 n=1 Tax=Stentor coeruleus TaxID=5963 RepID=A0A1R2BFY2_9CILI|nr:hypothetical protein SteCoe_25187 [Stentor coeruleus]